MFNGFITNAFTSLKFKKNYLKNYDQRKDLLNKELEKRYVMMVVEDDDVWVVNPKKSYIKIRLCLI